VGDLTEGWIHIKYRHGTQDWDLIWWTLEAGESDQYPSEDAMIMDIMKKTLGNPDKVYSLDNRGTAYESAFSYYDHRVEVKKTGVVCVIIGSRGQVVTAYIRDEWRIKC
jgi:hypothetical protein